MITAEEARARAEEEYNGGKPIEERDEIGLYEFEEGWVAWRVEPEPEDRTQPPATVGGSVIVIDRSAGEVTTYPNLPAPVIAEEYQRELRGE